MRTTWIAMSIAVLVASAAGHEPALAQQLGGVKRTDLQRHDLSAPGREVIQALVEFAPGVAAPRHSHPGEEIIFVIEGQIEYQIDGQPPTLLKAGDTLFVPAGGVHSARNVGSVKAVELATYIVEKQKPLIEIAK